MKNFSRLLMTIIILAAGAFAAGAQSNDIDAPTMLTSTVIEGEGDGKGETVYYAFTALKGDVKITVDAKTDYYSTPVQVTLLDEDGKELLPIYVVALGESKREVKAKRFVREQKVIIKIVTRDDAQVKLLSYKIKLDGTVKVETPPAEETTTPEETSKTSTTESQPETETKTDDEKTKKKDKIKNTMKKKGKETLKDIID